MPASSVVVTGSGSGVGLATSLEFARRGHRVFATVHDLARSGKLRSSAEREGLTVEIRALDVRDGHQAGTVVEQILNDAGHIDVLVNNAGVGGRAAVETAGNALVRDIFETNVFGVLHMQRAVLPGMRERHSGTIVNVSSVAGRVPVPFNGIYAASKHAVEAISEALAIEVGIFGVRVVVIEPGHFRTGMGDGVLARSTFSRESPYAARELASLAAVRKDWARGGDPHVVATLIADIAEGSAARLRWPVGDDAVALLRARESLDERAWLARMRASLGDAESTQ